MNHADLYELRKTYNQNQILLCFNGPFSQGLIEEIGNALKRYMQSEAASTSATMDVFAVYIELTQNIRQYSGKREYTESDASATVVIGRDGSGHYVVSAGNIVETVDGQKLQERVQELAVLDKAQLKALYKEQLRQPRGEAQSAGLGLIDIARKASAPVSCALREDEDGRCFFSLSVVI